MVSLLQLGFFFKHPTSWNKSKCVNQMLKLNTEHTQFKKSNPTKSSAQTQEILIFKNKYFCIFFATSNL